MSEDVNSISESIGICIKSLDAKVKFQNSKCEKICGDQRGEICEGGCMAKNHLTSKSHLLGVQVEHIKNIETKNGLVDAVLFNDGANLVSLLFAKSERIEEQVNQLAKYNLTKTEKLILKNYLAGFKHNEVANRLCISKATLRTHLNNIFKKLPTDTKDALVAAHNI